MEFEEKKAFRKRMQRLREELTAQERAAADKKGMRRCFRGNAIRRRSCCCFM